MFLTNKKKMDDMWFGQAGGVTLSQHGDSDSSFPGWQESFGEGTFLGNSDFPNDDASHLSVDEGFSATLREHGPSDERYPGRELTYKGPTSMNLDDFNDELSEMTVSSEPINQENIDDVVDYNIDSDDGEIMDSDETLDIEDMPETDTSEAGISGDSNMTMYLAIGAVVLVGGYLIMQKK
tara:strand:+ start:7472 stop:8011 length:540 start_codon:yes stop_codon:yes gene_type:complete